MNDTAAAVRAIERETTAAAPRAEGGAHGGRPGPARRVVAWAMAVAMLVMSVRSLDVVRVTNESIDEPFHLMHGLGDWTNYRQSLPIALRYNDPPLGGMLVALPLWLTGCSVGATLDGGFVDPVRIYNAPVFWGQPWEPDTLRYATAVWKCALMLPGVWAAFCWAWRLYGRAAAWLMWVILLFDPTMSAFLPMGTLDTPSVSAILLGAYLVWRYVEEPTPKRLVWAALGTAVAMLTKHTAIVLPLVAILSTLIVWPLRAERQSWRGAGVHTLRLLTAAGLTLVFMWPLTKFDVSPPLKVIGQDWTTHPPATPWQELDGPSWSKRPLPAGVYLGSVLEGQRHNEIGHKAYLLGERYGFGRWDYFPVVATYKTPIGFGLIAALGLLSFAWHRPRLTEATLMIAVALWWGLICSARINIGWRHALVPFAFTMLLACRIVADDPIGAWRGTLRRAMVAIAYGAGIASAVHATLWHPNYLPYVNLPRDRPWLDISDSNVDFGQAIRQVGTWLDEHADTAAHPIYFMRFGGHGALEEAYIRGRAQSGARLGELPTEGTLIISPVNITSQYDPRREARWTPLKSAEPHDTIGGTYLVFDLSRVEREVRAGT